MGTSSVAMQFEHRLILSSLSQKLGRQDLEEMLFVCEAFIPESIAEETLSVTALFRELEHWSLIGPGNYEFLKTILATIGRIDLVNKLPQAETMLESSVLTVAASERSTLLVVADSLRKKDVTKLAFLCCSKYSDGLSLIKELEEKGLVSGDSYGYLEQKLGIIGRYDLRKLLRSNREIASGKKVREEKASWSEEGGCGQKWKSRDGRSSQSRWSWSSFSFIEEFMTG